MSRLQEARDLIAATELASKPGDGIEAWQVHLRDLLVWAVAEVELWKRRASNAAGTAHERDLLRTLTNDLQKLLVCYRTNKSPGALLDRIGKTRTKLDDLKAEGLVFETEVIQ